MDPKYALFCKYFDLNFYLIYGSSEYQTKEGHEEFEGEGRGEGGEVKGEGNHGYKHSPTLFSEKKEKKKSVSPEKNDRKQIKLRI